MLTTLVSLFLTIFSALRATPIYSGILTLGNGFTFGNWFTFTVLPLLDSETTNTTGIFSGNGTRASVFSSPLALLSLPSPTVLSLPSSPVLLTLPAGPSTHRCSELLTLLALLVLVGSITLGLTTLLWRLRTETPVDNVYNFDKDTVIDLSGATYSSNVYTAGDDLAGVLEFSTSPLPATSVDTSATESSAATPNTSSALARKHRGKGKKTAKAARSTSSIASPPAQPASVITPTAIAAPHEVEEDNEGAWETWTNRRRRRPPRQPPPSASAFSASHTRSSSVFSTSRTSDTLFSSMSAASTAPTSTPPSRRSSIAAYSPAKRSPFSSRTRLPPSIASYNKFSVLEVFEVEE